jgi:AcrR family transcriptional regulator
MPSTPLGGVIHRGRPSEGVREAILAATLDLAKEEGLARLTTREVARRAGASEASIYYHFGDKTHLLQHAFLHGLEPLGAIDPVVLAGTGEHGTGDTLLAISASLEQFFDRVLPLLGAVQGDAALRADFGSGMADRGLGPHRGVELIANSLRALQRRGLVAADVDVESVALSIIGSCLVRAWERNVFGAEHPSQLPDRHRAIAATVELIAPSRT